MNRDDPLAGLSIGERPEPEPPDGWRTVSVRAASLNHHDLWSLRGVGLRARAAADDPRLRRRRPRRGRQRGDRPCGDHERHWRGDDTFDPRRSILSEATRGRSPSGSRSPARNVLPKPPELSFEEAACLPTAWLTAYRMLFTRGRLLPGQTVLVQGASGGVATALIVLGRRSRDPRVGDRALRGEARAGARARRRPGVRGRRRACPSASTR